MSFDFTWTESFLSSKLRLGHASLIEHTYMCPSPAQSAASLLLPPEKDAWWLAALWWLPLVSWWLWAPLASLLVLVLWVFWWVSGLLAFLWALGLSVSLLWLPSLLLSLPWLQKNRFEREINIVILNQYRT